MSQVTIDIPDNIRALIEWRQELMADKSPASPSSSKRWLDEMEKCNRLLATHLQHEYERSQQ